MKTSQLAVIFACIAAAIATPVDAVEPAAALVARDDGYVEHSRERAKHHAGNLIWYTKKAGSKRSADLEDRAVRTCKSTAESGFCSTSNTARNGVCDSLVNELNGDGQVGVIPGTQQVCYEGDSDTNAYCCAAWADKITDLTKGDIAGPAYTIEKVCTESGISGKLENIKIAKTCTNFCLSNRGTNCT